MKLVLALLKVKLKSEQTKKGKELIRQFLIHAIK